MRAEKVGSVLRFEQDVEKTDERHLSFGWQSYPNRYNATNPRAKGSRETPHSLYCKAAL